MANKTYKATQIVRTGYEYQDLVGIEALIHFFRNPEIYKWIKLEAVEDSFGALDDLVIARTDGKFEFTQVKFTVDVAEYFLDWDWLLERKGKGTSMLAKWVKSLAEIRALGPIESAQLRTNRQPSADFAAAMVGDFIDLTKLSANKRQIVESECGGAQEAKLFFDAFAFKCREKDLDAFERAIRGELVPSHFNQGGWAFFRDQVRRWATRINEPHPDGRILHRHLTQLISSGRSEPIRQDFVVSQDYQIPSQTFHDQFKARISDPATPLTVLWGTPGRGKSTYLSFLTNELQCQGKIVIRHHYFLSAADNSDRMSFFEIANSLLSQLVARCPDDIIGASGETEQLRKVLESAASRIAARGDILYIFIDGLDHVWRDTRKVDQLNFLFNKLLPLPKGISLVVGTQRVDASQLPSRLNSEASSADWREISAMDQVAVHRWVKNQFDKGRLLVHENLRGSNLSEALHQVGDEFFNVSQGHPLHLIYTFQGLARSGRAINATDVANSPICPDGDIRKYYDNLWNSLDPKSREILHAISGSDFSWPSLGIRQCLGSFDNISFLLQNRNSGVAAFHQSIFAYVREREDHEESFRSLLPKIVEWLRTDAPPYWRWGWYWLGQARLGNRAELMSGTTRNWAIESLAQGWPTQQIKNIVEAAEIHAFASGDFPRTLELRSIKTRVMNSRQFQIQHYALFEEAALLSAANLQQLRNLVDELPSLADDEIISLVRASPDEIREEIATVCVQEYKRRINVWIQLRHRSGSEFVTLAKLFIDAVSLTKTPDIMRVANFLLGFKNRKVISCDLLSALGEQEIWMRY